MNKTSPEKGELEMSQLIEKIGKNEEDEETDTANKGVR